MISFKLICAGFDKTGDWQENMEKETEREDLIASIEPHILASLKYISEACQKSEKFFKVTKESRWWSQISKLEISDLDCKKSAYMRALKSVSEILSH